jgi:putative transposase
VINMANKQKYMRTALDRAVTELQELQETRPLTPADLRAQASTSGYSVKHIKRKLAAADKPGEPTTGEPSFSVTEMVISAVFMCCGVMAQAYVLLKGQMSLPSERTFRRHVRAEMGSQLVYARGGSADYRDKQVYLRNDYPHRMHSVLLDHAELPIYVVPRGHKHAVKPWITAVMDAYSRYILSWVVTFGTPTSEEVRAALVQAMPLRYAPDGETIVGGRPYKAIWDRGLDFLSKLISESCLRLDIMPVALPAYSPHHKGRLERFWRTLKESLLPRLPGYVEGPRDLRGHYAIGDAALGEDEFLVLLADWMDDYLTNHVIRTIGMTPLEAWRSDGTPLIEIAPERLWQDFLIAKERCKVGKEGIRWDTINWIAPELMSKGGEHVEIRYLPHDRHFIEVFYNGDHLCTAFPIDAASDELKQDVIDQRRRERATARKRFTSSNRLRRANHTDVHKIEKLKDGRRHVVEPADDLLSGGAEALDELLRKRADDGDDQSRLF